MERLLPYLSMATVHHIMVGLKRMLDYRGVRLQRFHCSNISLSLSLKFVFSFRMLWIVHVVAVYLIVQLIGHYHVQGEDYRMIT